MIFFLLPQELPDVLIQVSTDFKEMWHSVSISLLEKRYRRRRNIVDQNAARIIKTCTVDKSCHVNYYISSGDGYMR